MADFLPRRTRRALTVLGLALLVGPPMVWWSMQEATDVGDLRPPPPTLSAATPSRETQTGRDLPRRSGLLSQQDDPPVAMAPLVLRLPTIAVAADIVPVGIASDGAMEIPAEVDEVGWYRFGPAPGDPGTAVIAGHVDSRTQGRGAFYDLRRLEVGDRVVVETAGSTSTWEVVARRQYGKDIIPLEEVFSRDGPPRLTLITCGGAFDAQTGHYRDNIVVYAVPATLRP